MLQPLAHSSSLAARQPNCCAPSKWCLLFLLQQIANVTSRASAAYMWIGCFYISSSNWSVQDPSGVFGRPEDESHEYKSNEGLRPLAGEHSALPLSSPAAALHSRSLEMVFSLQQITNQHKPRFNSRASTTCSTASHEYKLVIRK